jgi:dihydrofolate reductase
MKFSSRISLIVAVADNNVIGKDNAMPWHIPEDFKHFKSVTIGKPCIMGRKTFESILAQLGKPLPGRSSIVISRSGFGHENAITCGTIADAITAAQKENPEEIMIIGGAQIYAQALDQKLVDRIYLTRVHQSPTGDAFFPDLDMNEWVESERDTRDGFSFITLNKK